MSIRESFLVFHDFRYLKLAFAAVGASLVWYVLDNARGGPSGSSWLGYTLGTIGALIIVWLMWFGVRKRSYGPGHWQLEAWLSAHVYLGLALLVIVTLHTGLRFHTNVHTLAYALMALTIASGLFGVFIYIRYPRLMTENRRGQTLRVMLLEVADLDRRSREACLDLPDEFAHAVEISHQQTHIGGSLARHLSGRDPNCGTTRALAQVAELAKSAGPERLEAVSRLLIALGRKQSLLAQIRRDLRYKAFMEVWLYLHVPLSFALLAALVAHIVSVFFYF